MKEIEGKAVILGDCHLDVSNGNNRILRDNYDYLLDVADYCRRNGIKHIFQLGDMTHNRTHVSLLAMDLILDFLEHLDTLDIQFHHLLGNHDLYYKDRRDVYSMKPFKNLPNVHIYEKQEWVNFNDKMVLMVPWLIDDESIIADKNTKLILGHFDIKDFNMTRFHVSTHGLDRKVFKNIKVLSGHYHTKQTQGNITYVGTPWQMTWEDFDTEHGFHVLDENLELEFIENNKSGKHVKAFINTEKKSVDIVGLYKEPTTFLISKIDAMILNKCKVKVYANKELAIVRKFIDEISGWARSVKVEIIEEDLELDEEKMIEEAQNLDVGSKICSIAPTELQPMIEEIKKEAEEELERNGK